MSAKKKFKVAGARVNCQHYEIITRHDGKLIGTCQKCGQVKQYDPIGHDMPVILKEGKIMGTNVKHRYYEEHRGEILEDLRRSGTTATRKKWGIASSTWHQLKQRWLPAADPAQAVDSQISYPQGNIASEKPQSLPALPEFNESWGDVVKAAWFVCLAALTRAE